LFALGGDGFYHGVLRAGSPRFHSVRRELANCAYRQAGKGPPSETSATGGLRSVIVMAEVSLLDIVLLIGSGLMMAQAFLRWKHV